MIIAIPSKGRAGKTKTDKLVTSGVFFVPASEVRDYRLFLKNEVVAVPDEVRGITATRNWILKYSKDPRVVFLDDDLKVQGYVDLSQKAKHIPLTLPQWTAEFEKLFDITEQMNLRIFGVATNSAPRAVYPYRPFIFHTYVTASCMGILNDGRTLFDESFPVKEDYELCLRCLKEDGAVLGARYLYWENFHWSGDGGCRDYRTQSMELEAINRLIDLYPGLIRRVTRGGSEYSIELDFK